MRARRGLAAMLARFAIALVVLAAAAISIAWFRVASIDVASLARRNPARTALMLEREREARRSGRRATVRQAWVPYDRIAPSLRRSVLVAEDDAFFAHGGLDWTEIRESAKRNLEARRVVRGGSTITQQLAKNLWLGSSRSPWRKLEEMLLAFRMERTLTKRRIFELYLNVIEWGDGVYGAEAASRRWFGVGAGSLTVPQAVRLAAVIINPRRYSPTEPSRRIESRIRRIASRLLRRGAISDAEYRAAVGLPPAETTGIELPLEPALPPETQSLPDTEVDTPAPAAPADTLPG